MFAVLGMASNWASNGLVCEGMVLSCQAPALVRQLEVVAVIAAVLLFPSLVAQIVAEPVARPVTKPLALTVATAALLLAHVTSRPVSTVPVESFAVAVNWVVAPTVRLAAVGLTVTDATGTLLSVTAAVSASVPPL